MGGILDAGWCLKCRIISSFLDKADIAPSIEELAPLLPSLYIALSITTKVTALIRPWDLHRDLLRSAYNAISITPCTLRLSPRN